MSAGEELLENLIFDALAKHEETLTLSYADWALIEIILGMAGKNLQGTRGHRCLTLLEKIKFLREQKENSK